MTLKPGWLRKPLILAGIIICFAAGPGAAQANLPGVLDTARYWGNNYWSSYVKIDAETTIRPDGLYDQIFLVHVSYSGELSSSYMNWVSQARREFIKLGWNPQIKKLPGAYEIKFSRRLRPTDDFFPHAKAASVVKHEVKRGLTGTSYDVRLTLPYELKQTLRDAPGLSMTWKVKAPAKIVETNADKKSGEVATWTWAGNQEKRFSIMTALARESNPLAPALLGLLFLAVFGYGAVALSRGARRQIAKATPPPSPTAQWFCGKCGIPNPSDYEFCGKCGTKRLL